MTDVVVVPPSWQMWWDLTATTNAVLAQLRLTETDVDAARVREIVPGEGQKINAFLDRPDDAVPAPIAVLQWAIERASVDAYLAARAGQGSPDDYSIAGITSRLASADTLANVRPALMPHKRRFGIS